MLSAHVFISFHQFKISITSFFYLVDIGKNIDFWSHWWILVDLKVVWHTNRMIIRKKYIYIYIYIYFFYLGSYILVKHLFLLLLLLEETLILDLAFYSLVETLDFFKTQLICNRRNIDFFFFFFFFKSSFTLIDRNTDWSYLIFISKNWFFLSRLIFIGRNTYSCSYSSW